ncbi:DgyrCDS14195 [Dimorphilus gyrociliatus]|uniref:protein-serine/threonine phosphatase n=1 Tax=Dimorphilus gyrociliatus TaxID=2664684 RepID=A0A7I8WCV4_9ANNE|nr:DgyrCDS14195 [Dimorphilus gyrociliatus]
MSLVTVTRSPTPNNVPQSPFTFTRTAHFSLDDTNKHSISHNYVALKGAALILPLSECVHRRIDSSESIIHHHLQMICDLLCLDHCLKIAVHLESANDNHIRYMALVSPEGEVQFGPAAVILGIDIIPFKDGRETCATIGLILPLFCDMDVRLCEDGYFVVASNNEQNFFKPVSVQVLWSALQSLYVCQEMANNPKHLNKLNRSTRRSNDWTADYKVNSVYANISEWNKSCEDIEIKFTSPIYDLHKSPTELEMQRKIEGALREIMAIVDLEEVTTVMIREKLEKKLSMNLHSRKSWIDEKILVVLEQFNSPSTIRDYLLLGSEGNASDLKELKRQNVTHILNITREVDNFYPNREFVYMNIRVDDDENAWLLNEWDSTNAFISQAKELNSKVLVHCKMGVSRSAATVIAHLMKCEGMRLDQALKDVKTRRPVIRPNRNFMRQLSEYENILEASGQRRRFKVETTFQLSPIANRCTFSDCNTRSTPDLSIKCNDKCPRRGSCTPPTTPNSKRKIVTDSVYFPLNNSDQRDNFVRYNSRDRNTQSGVHRSQSMRERGAYSKVELERWSGQEYEDYEHLTPGVIQRRLRALTEPERRSIESDTPPDNNVVRQGFVQQQAQTIERSTPPETPKPVRASEHRREQQEIESDEEQDQDQKHTTNGMSQKNNVVPNHNDGEWRKKVGQDRNRVEVRVQINPHTFIEAKPASEAHCKVYVRGQAQSLKQNRNRTRAQAREKIRNRGRQQASDNYSSAESSIEEYADAGPKRFNSYKDCEDDSDMDYTSPFQWMKAEQLARMRRAIAKNTRKKTES